MVSVLPAGAAPGRLGRSLVAGGSRYEGQKPYAASNVSVCHADRHAWPSQGQRAKNT